MKHFPQLLFAVFLIACTSPQGKEGTTPTTTGTVTPLPGAKAYERKDLPTLDDNVRHDTLLIYTTHDLGNGRFVMAARNIEEDREGLRLVLYRPRPDSSAEVLAISKPAYDSAVMLPTFYATGDTADGIIILANYGERESWGQNAFWLKDGRLIDLGWLDVAERTWVEQDGERQQRRVSIASHTEVAGIRGQFDFTFNTDSVQLYDDLRGDIEVMVASPRILYRFDGKDMVLWMDGEARYPSDPF